MRIFWFHSGLMPAACEANGYDNRVSCGWLESMLNALLALEPSLEFCLLGWDSRPCDVQIGRVRHVSFGAGGKTWCRNIPKPFSDKASSLIREFKPDVIHVQGTEYFYGRLDSTVYNDVPVVVSLQGILSELHLHYLGNLAPSEFHGTNFNARFFVKGRTILQEQKEWREGRAWQEQLVFRQQKYFIGRTEWDRACVEFYNPHARYFTVNENLRPPFFNERRCRKNIRKHTIYCGGAASCALKGAHWLLHAVAALKDEFPDIQLRIAAAQKVLRPTTLMGWLNDQSYFAYLRRLIHKLGVENHVVCLPQLPAEQVAEELKRAELFVLPSLCENSPNSLGEAMLVGTPSIATFCGGVPSILKDGVEGKLVPPGEPFSLAAAIRHYFLHPDEAEAMVGAARATALKRHDARANAQATLDVYRQICKKDK